jgi:hypothetical protein
MDWLNDGIAVNNPDILSNGVDLGFSVGMTCCRPISLTVALNGQATTTALGLEGV